MFVYFAHPIDQATQDGENSIRLKRMIQTAQSACVMQGISFFKPGRAYTLSTMADSVCDPADLRAINGINRLAVWESHGIIAILPPGIPTLGVPAEIEQGLLLNRPVLILTTAPLAETSVQILDWVGRGVQVRLMDDEGGWFNDKQPNLVEALGSLPDPTKLITLAETNSHPPLIFKQMSTNAKFPTRAYPDDAGLDLAVVGEHDIEPGDYQLLPTGIAAAVPEGWWGFMTGRSSAWFRWQLDIRTAVIDSGYRGELMIGVHNRGSERRTIMTGTRLAQYILLPAFQGQVIQEDELPDHVRGTNGYGSSGH